MSALQHASLVTALCTLFFSLLCAPVAAFESFSQRPGKVSLIPSSHSLSDITFSKSARRFAVLATANGKAQVFYNGKGGGQYESVKNILVNDKGGFAYIGVRKSGKQVVVNRGIEGKEYDSIESLQLDEEGTPYYSASSSGNYSLVAGTREALSAGKTAPQLAVSLHGKRAAFSVSGTGVVNLCDTGFTVCRPSKRHASVSSLAIDEKGDRITFITGSEGSRQFVTAVVSGTSLRETAGDKYRDIISHAISPNGSHYAYIGAAKEKHFLVTDGKKSAIPSVSTVFSLVVSNSGSTVYSTADNDAVVTYLNGKLHGKPYDEIEYITFSPDGRNMAFVDNRSGKSILVVNFQDKGTFDKIVSPTYTGDGRKLIFRARKGEKRFVAVTDASGNNLKQLRHYDAVWPPAVSPDGAGLGYLVKSGAEFYWIVEKL